MRVEHSELRNEFITFWIETRVDGVYRYDTFIDFLRCEWYSCPAVEGPILIRGQYDSVMAEAAIIEFVKLQVDHALAAGRI
jgi:hypothetical protein